jgi:predicted DNA-binding transcriptional regulator AlpA
MRVELQTVLALASSLPPDRLPEFIGELEVCRITAISRLAPAKDEDETIDAREAARRLGISRPTLYRNHKKRPYSFMRPEGGKLVADAAELRKYQQAKRR